MLIWRLQGGGAGGEEVQDALQLCWSVQRTRHSIVSLCPEPWILLFVSPGSALSSRPGRGCCRYQERVENSPFLEAGSAGRGFRSAQPPPEWIRLLPIRCLISFRPETCHFSTHELSNVENCLSFLKEGSGP